MPRQKNLLSPLASYNAIFSIASMSKDDLQSEEYKNPDWAGFNNGQVLFRGAGQTPSSKVLASDEGAPMSYYMEDVEIKSLVTPGINRGNTSNTDIRFTLIEPYSMGMLLQNLVTTAQEAGNIHYIGAPFLLRIDFRGFNTDGAPVDMSNKSNQRLLQRNIPFKFTDIQLQYTAAGTRYECRAIPWSALALQAPYSVLPADATFFSFDGTVKGALSSLNSRSSVDIQSLDSVLNAHYQSIANDDHDSKYKPHKYYFIFPEKNEGSFNENQTANNKWGKSKFDKKIKDTMVKPKDNKESQDKPQSRFTANKDGAVKFAFPKGTPIVKVIEEVLLNSDEMRKYIEKDYFADSQDPYIDWFKIETEVNLRPDEQTFNILGQHPKEFVFKIVPYRIVKNKVRTPGEIPDYKRIQTNIVKQYDFLYTGTNQDVLDFNIKLDHAFFVPLMPGFTDIATKLQSKAIVKDKLTENKAVPSTGRTEDNTLGTPAHITPNTMHVSPGGITDYTPDSLDALAKFFNNAMLNSPVDLVEIDFEIWGDPYFLPDNGVGNYNSRQGDILTITKNGAINWSRSEVDLMLNFRTPVDIDTDKGIYKFPKENNAAVFSGIYQVIEIVNTFSSGEFKNSLKCLRRLNSKGGDLDEAPNQASPLVFKSYEIQDTNTSNVGKVQDGKSFAVAVDSVGNVSALGSLSSPGDEREAVDEIVNIYNNNVFKENR